MTPSKLSKRSAMSVLLSNAMDFMGYDKEMIRCRQNTYRTLDKISNINNKDGPCSRFTTGGKSEGIARYFELYFLHTVRNVICTDEPALFEDANHITLFKVENTDTPPGYVKLRLLKHNGDCLNEEIYDSLFENPYGEKYISSIKFIENIKESTIWLPGFTKQAKSGPSSPVSNGYLSIDRVVSLSCILRKEYAKFNRLELLRWRDIIDTVTSRGVGFKVHAVPVGNKLSTDKYLEWRLSYTEAEITLIKNLNMTNLKVYILLKLMARTIFKPICNEMTSYLMKNVILWTSSRHSHTLGRTTNILDILQCCLDFLRKSLQANCLPSFMIPKRNLLCGRVGFHENRKMISILTNMLNSGPSMIFCCAKVKIAIHALIKVPQAFKAYSVYRNEIEKMILVLCTCRARLRTPGVTQDQYDRILIQDNVYRTTKLKILAQIGLFDPSAQNAPEDVEEILKSTKGEYYERLSQMLS